MAALPGAHQISPPAARCDHPTAKSSLRSLSRLVLLAATLALALGSCKEKSPTQPQVNHPPTILSVSVTPNPIGLSESTLVVCNAVDPDGDSLSYDWYSQRPIFISGAPDVVNLIDTRSNACTFYYAVPWSMTTYVPIQVFVRDPRGLQAGVEFRIYLQSGTPMLGVRYPTSATAIPTVK